MSEMSQAQSQTGGDPLDLVGAVGTEDDVLPGPPGGAEAGEESARNARPGDSSPEAGADPAPEAGATLDPPGRTMNIDPDAGKDPLDDVDTDRQRPLGVGDSSSGSDPMPDMSGTTKP